MATISKSTVVGVVLGAGVLYAAKQELPTLKEHPFHTSVIAFFLLLAITLIFLPQGLLGKPDVEKV